MALHLAPVSRSDAGRRFLTGGRTVAALTLAVVAALAIGPSPLLIGPLAIAVVTADLVRIDIENSRLPNRLVLPCYPAAIVGIALDGILTRSAPVAALAAGLAWFVFFLLLHLGGGMGMGDVKLAGVLGLCLGSLGVAHAVLGIVLVFVTGGIAGVIVLARRVGGWKHRIPFGPFLLAGFWIAVAVGPAVTAVSTP